MARGARPRQDDGVDTGRPRTRRLPWEPRFELRYVRTDDPTNVVQVRSRHRLRALAELSRRLEADHAALLTGCTLVLVDRDGG